MQPGRGEGGHQEMKPNQQQDRRLKPLQGESQQQQQQQHQPQKCPRCESLNTKFCYYNNYSLSQPRYFCKTCRRYWTQGGTLRNVPVGGGCRKGKRPKTTSSGENSRLSQSQTAQVYHQQNLAAPQNLISSNPMISGIPALRTKESANLATPEVSTMGSYYPSGSFFSSLAAIQALNHPQPFTQALTVGGELGGSSNMGLLQGYSVPSFGSQQHHQPIQQTQFFQMADRERGTIYQSQQESLIPSSRPGSSASQSWNQGFINSTNAAASDAALWRINSGGGDARTSGNTNSNNAGSPSLNPNQWPDLPGYGAPR